MFLYLRRIIDGGREMLGIRCGFAEREKRMTIRKSVTAAIVAASMIVVPTVAQAAVSNSTAASKLSLRAAAPKDGKESHIAGVSTIVLVLAAAAVVGGVIALASKKKTKSP
jgi:hypothetical protein